MTTPANMLSNKNSGEDLDLRRSAAFVAKELGVDVLEASTLIEEAQRSPEKCQELEHRMRHLGNDKKRLLLKILDRLEEALGAVQKRATANRRVRP